MAVVMPTKWQLDGGFAGSVRFGVVSATRTLERYVPTMQDAQNAAAAVAECGASRVLVFGSVARDESKSDSDIDLVAIFDDLADYSARRRLRGELASAARRAVKSVPNVDVFVTDRPEWRIRTGQVSASFEANIARDAVELFDRAPVCEVRWGKDIGLPATNEHEALQRLQEMSEALGNMTSTLFPDEMELTSTQARRRDVLRPRRLRRVASYASVSIETALKSLAAFSGVRPPRSHDIWKLLSLTGEYSDLVAMILSELRDNSLRLDMPSFDDIGMWQQAGTYLADWTEVDLEYLSEHVPKLVQACCHIADLTFYVVADDHKSDPRVLSTYVEIREAKRRVASGDFVTGKLHPARKRGVLAWLGGLRRRRRPSRSEFDGQLQLPVFPEPVECEGVTASGASCTRPVKFVPCPNHPGSPGSQTVMRRQQPWVTAS